MQKIAILKNTIQEYAWGSSSALADLLGAQNRSHNPQAELWMGAHPKAPSLVQLDGGWVSLSELIENNPQDILGKEIAAKFDNKLPYLFKVLAAAKPLSIQAHPDSAQAKEGFARENNLGIALNAPHRNYRDPNHKPECICALTPFWALCGFRKIKEILAFFRKICSQSLSNELDKLQGNQHAKGLKDFFSMLLTIDAERRKKIISEAVANAKKRSEENAAFEWILKLLNEYSDDIGILSPILLNLVCLEPGQAMFLAAGQLHAYLDGVGIELMANSDNVLRGGLTSKHIDVSELLKILHFHESGLNFLKPEQINHFERVFTSPAEEFVLSVIVLDKDAVYQSLRSRGVEILLCTEGKAEIKDLGSHEVTCLKKGISVIIPDPVERYELKGEAIIYKASVPI